MKLSGNYLEKSWKKRNYSIRVKFNAIGTNKGEVGCSEMQLKKKLINRLNNVSTYLV